VVSRTGPLYLRGDVEIVDDEGRTLLRDTRVALCRCGASRNKPLCDGNHWGSGFRDLGNLPEGAEPPAAEPRGALRVRLRVNGPLVLEGPMLLVSGDGQSQAETGRAVLCRCGGSGRKPFCDGTHKTNGFTSA
jgi:CDGSH-type Zn-finger protein